MLFSFWFLTFLTQNSMSQHMNAKELAILKMEKIKRGKQVQIRHVQSK